MGQLCGFDTRRTTEKKDDDDAKRIITKYVVCSRSGFKERKKIRSDRSTSRVRRTVSKRCGCNAKVILKFVSGENYRISVFVEDHNHELASKS